MKVKKIKKMRKTKLFMNIDKIIFKLFLILCLNTLEEVFAVGLLPAAPAAPAAPVAPALVPCPHAANSPHFAATLDLSAPRNPAQILPLILPDRVTALAARAHAFSRFIEILPSATLIALATTIVLEPKAGYLYYHEDGKPLNIGLVMAIIRGVYYPGVDNVPFVGGESLRTHVEDRHLVSSAPATELKSFFNTDKIDTAMMYVRFVLNIIRPENYGAAVHLVRPYVNDADVANNPNVVYIQTIDSKRLSIKIYYNFGYDIGMYPLVLTDPTSYVPVTRLQIVLSKERGRWIFKTAFVE